MTRQSLASRTPIICSCRSENVYFADLKEVPISINYFNIIKGKVRRILRGNLNNLELNILSNLTVSSPAGGAVLCLLREPCIK